MDLRARYLHHRADIEALLDPRCYTIDWLDGEVASGRIMTWADRSALILAQVRTFPAGAREIHGMVAVGALQGILGLIERAEAWAVGQGIEFASIASRSGWARVLKSCGYYPHQVELRKELN